MLVFHHSKELTINLAGITSLAHQMADEILVGSSVAQNIG